jgi:hypothetical protein
MLHPKRNRKSPALPHRAGSFFRQIFRLTGEWITAFGFS